MLNDERNSSDLAARTKRLALRIIRLYNALPKRGAAQVIGMQVLRCGTSVGAQYREARSQAEFISKIESLTQELDETAYWLELLIEAVVVKEQLLTPLLAEVDELMAVFVTSAKTAKSRSFQRRR